LFQYQKYKDDIVNALQTVVLADSEDETETDRMVKQAVISLTEVKPTANEKPVIDDNLTVGVNAICESAHSPRLGRETPVEHVAMRHQQHCDICFAPSLFSIDCLLQTRNSTADASASPYDEGLPTGAPEPGLLRRVSSHPIAHCSSNSTPTDPTFASVSVMHNNGSLSLSLSPSSDEHRQRHFRRVYHAVPHPLSASFSPPT